MFQDSNLNDWKVESKSSESSFFMKCWKDIFLSSSIFFFPFLFFFSGWASKLNVAEGCPVTTGANSSWHWFPVWLCSLPNLLRNQKNLHKKMKRHHNRRQKKRQDNARQVSVLCPHQKNFYVFHSFFSRSDSFSCCHHEQDISTIISSSNFKTTLPEELFLLSFLKNF